MQRLTPGPIDATKVSGESIRRVVVSSRIRLARNMRGVAFPGWASAQERERVYERVCHALQVDPAFECPVVRPMDALSSVEREVLVERHLISPEMATAQGAAGVIYDEQAGVSVMINEEDHLRIQCLRSGFGLRPAWVLADDLDDRLNENLQFAFNPELGFLTACPSNTGTGIRASVMLHLAALRMLQESDAVVRALGRMGYAVRGILGEGSRACGGFFQISNQRTLGIREDETLSRMETITLKLVDLEIQARKRLLEDRVVFYQNQVGRSYGILRYAATLSASEATQYLSDMVFGVESGMISGVDLVTLHSLIRQVQPAHLQLKLDQNMNEVERDQARVTLLREALKTMQIRESI